MTIKYFFFALLISNSYSKDSNDFTIPPIIVSYQSSLGQWNILIFAIQVRHLSVQDYEINRGLSWASYLKHVSRFVGHILNNDLVIPWQCIGHRMVLCVLCHDILKQKMTSVWILIAKLSISEKIFHVEFNSETNISLQLFRLNDVHVQK